MTAITGLNHITLTTKNLAKSVAFYQDVLDFPLVARWQKGAYFLVNQLWLCLIENPKADTVSANTYTHIAFDVAKEHYAELLSQVKTSGVSIWQDNVSEGDSIYIHDPDFHKLEIHASSLIARVSAMKQQPYAEQTLFEAHINQCPIALPTPMSRNGITVRPMQLDDISAIYEAGKAADIWQWLPRGEFISMDDTAEWVHQAISCPNSLAFVVLNEENKIIGSTRFLDINTQHKSLEIGYTWLHADYWQSAVNPIVKSLLLSYLFDTLHFVRVQLKTDKRNLRSQKAMEKIGALREGVLRNQMIVKDGFVRDSVFYSIIDKDWQQGGKALLETIIKKRLTTPA